MLGTWRRAPGGKSGNGVDTPSTRASRCIAPAGRANRIRRSTPGLVALSGRLTLSPVIALPPVLHLDTEPGWRGGQQQLLLLHRGLCAAGMDSTVLCRRDDALAQRLAHDHLPSITCTSGTLTTARAVRAWLRHHPTGIIHAHASAAHAAARLAVIGHSRTPLIVTRRVDFALKSGVIARWKYGPRITRFIAVSAAIAGVLTRGGVAPAQITVIPDGAAAPPAIDVPTCRHEVRRSAQIDEHALLVLCPAALVAHKGHRVLIEAWRMIADDVPHAHLLLAGRGDLEDALRQQAATVPRVHFLGWRDDLPQVIAACDAATLTSVEEGLGSALIECQLAGLPIVASRAGGIPEVVADGHSGLLAPVGDSAAVAQHLRRILSDDALRHRLSQGARQHASTLSADVMVERHRTLYAGFTSTTSSTASSTAATP
jgi:L-malate glycosyltransferase